MLGIFPLKPYEIPLLKFAVTWLAIAVILWIGYDEQDGFSQKSAVLSMMFGSFSILELRRDWKKIRDIERFKQRKKAELEDQ